MEILGVGVLAAEDYNLENYLEKEFSNHFRYFERQNDGAKTGKDHQKHSLY
ncbi:hypothetical protein OIU92_08650 [Escherichia coli]|nr:hypothetical protein [Escherichia coli]